MLGKASSLLDLTIEILQALLVAASYLKGQHAAAEENLENALLLHKVNQNEQTADQQTNEGQAHGLIDDAHDTHNRDEKYAQDHEQNMSDNVVATAGDFFNINNILAVLQTACAGCKGDALVIQTRVGQDAVLAVDVACAHLGGAQSAYFVFIGFDEQFVRCHNNPSFSLSFYTEVCVTVIVAPGFYQFKNYSRFVHIFPCCTTFPHSLY